MEKWPFLDFLRARKLRAVRRFCERRKITENFKFLKKFKILDNFSSESFFFFFYNNKIKNKEENLRPLKTKISKIFKLKF